MTTIGIIGAGHIGSALARAFSGIGYDVVISNSRGPETLADLVADLGPKVSAATAADAAAAADIAVVTVPVKALPEVPVAPLAGKIVLDTNNYYFERDGHIESLDRGEETVSGLLQKHLPTSKVVKAFNHIHSYEITTAGHPAGDPKRRALGTSSDFPEAIELVTGIYDALGYDTVNLGPLAESWRIERDRPAYAPGQTADQLRENLALANRVL
jgi:predicted dinucleotide-binding enzyme